MDKLEKKMIKQENAIAETLASFLKHFNRAWYSIEEPVRELDKFFDLTTDENGTVYIFVKTKEWDFPMGYTTDIDLADLQNVVNYIKYKARIYLHNCKENGI